MTFEIYFGTIYFHTVGGWDNLISCLELDCATQTISELTCEFIIVETGKLLRNFGSKGNRLRNFFIRPRLAIFLQTFSFSLKFLRAVQKSKSDRKVSNFFGPRH